MGCVWAARHEGIDREVALKIPEGVNADNPELRNRFLAEARALGRLRHPNIVDVLDSGKLDDGRLFIAFELLEGSGLDVLLHEAGRMRGADAVKIAIELCRGLEFAHRAGVIHRDLKPANVYLHQLPDGGALVKLLDFGISKTFEGGVAVSLTHTGNVVGTPLYMSAEQARGEPIDHRTDLWNIGVLIYEMLAGLAPFEGKSYSATVAKIVSEDPPPLADWGVFAAPELEAVIRKCLQRDREARYATARDLRLALEDVLPLVKHATPPRLSIASLSDWAENSAAPSAPITFTTSHGRAFSPEAPTLPPPASSLRPVTNSFALVTPAPSNVTLAQPKPAKPRSWAIIAGAASSFAVIGALTTFFALRSPSASLPSSAPQAPASSALDVAVSPLLPAASTSAASVTPAAQSAAPEPVIVAPDRAKPRASSAPPRSSAEQPKRTKVDDPGF